MKRRRFGDTIFFNMQTGNPDGPTGSPVFFPNFDRFWRFNSGSPVPSRNGFAR
jgi:hypothetical protein